MRLFVAAEIGECLAGRAEALIVELKRRVTETAPRARVTWLTAPRLHLTITFIGEADHARAETVLRALGPPVPVPAFDLDLTGVGVFPKRGPPRAVWVGAKGGRDVLVAVEREVASRLAPLGIPSEGRPYSPHLTLARVRTATGLRADRLLEGLERSSLGTTRIAAITLFESRLSPTGPTYVPMLRTSLGGPT